MSQNGQTQFKNLAAKYVWPFCYMHESVKVGFLPSKKKSFICRNESPLKIIKNVFYFILKALFVLKIFQFCLDFLVMSKKQLD